MTPSRLFRSVTAAFLLALLIAGSVPAVSGIEAALGETIPLSGYSPTGQWVYLYLTGPNLPANGVMLNDVTKRADEGYFTRVAVDGNDFWSYKWSTANVGGRLDAGTYTIWVVNGPNDRSNLANADFRTVPVTLGKPSISAEVSRQNGALELDSVPTGASVSVNSRYRGTTPFTVTDLLPGTYQVTFNRDGYYEFNTPVAVQAGMVSEVKATLLLLPQPTPVQTSPPKTAPLPTPTPTADGFLPGVFLAGLIAIAIAGRRT
ncbi:MAG TPA: PEGA domain-containing protein [Methanoregula sp.]|nr:PEGA domain-containing protein [Methanoregula sp.]